jgi:hypothetical protein
MVANAPANQADGVITKQLQSSLRGPDDWDLTISNADSAVSLVSYFYSICRSIFFFY